MGRFRELHVLPATFSGDVIHDRVTVVNDVTVIATAQTTTTATFTPTRVDTGTANTATGAVDMTGTDANRAANMQTAVRALGGIYATATVVAGTAGTYIFTVLGGYDITWATTASSPTVTETGSAGGTTAVPGSVSYVKQLGIGKQAEIKKIVAKGFNDNSLDISVVDKDSKNVFVTTAIDTSTASADTPFVKLLTAAGVAGEDGAAAALADSGVFSGPLTVTIATSAPVVARGLAPRLTLVAYRPSWGEGRMFIRTWGAKSTLSGDLYLGAPVVKVKRIKLLASSDTTVAPTLTDADGLVIYTKTSSDYTTAVLEQLTHEGVNQANSAVADLLDVVAKSPVTLSGSGLGAGTFAVTLWVEV